MSLYVARREADMPIPRVPSVSRTCATCKANVWVDRNVVEFADSAEIRCHHCYKPEKTDQVRALIHPTSLRDLLSGFN